MLERGVPRLLLFGLLILGAVYALMALLAAFRKLDDKKRRRAGFSVLGLLGVALVIGVLARFGLQWLGVVGAAMLAVLRGIAPWLLRLWPLGQRIHEQRARAAGSRSHAGSAAGDDHDPAPRASSRGDISRREALEVLGLAEGASREDIMQAYRNLIRKVHPDSPGGSTYLATKINQAKDTLLGAP